MQVLRWLLTVPAAILGCYLGFFAGILIHYVHVWACPKEHLVSGACMAPWSLFVMSTAVGLSAAIAAAGVVLLPTLLAPSHRWLVARVAFACGLLFACVLVLCNAMGDVDSRRRAPSYRVPVCCGLFGDT